MISDGRRIYLNGYSSLFALASAAQAQAVRRPSRLRDPPSARPSVTARRRAGYRRARDRRLPGDPAQARRYTGDA